MTELLISFKSEHNLRSKNKNFTASSLSDQNWRWQIKKKPSVSNQSLVWPLKVRQPDSLSRRRLCSLIGSVSFTLCSAHFLLLVSISDPFPSYFCAIYLWNILILTVLTNRMRLIQIIWPKRHKSALKSQSDTLFCWLQDWLYKRSEHHLFLMRHHSCVCVCSLHVCVCVFTWHLC